MPNPDPSRPPLKVDVSFDLDAYLSTWEHGVAGHSSDGTPEEGWFPQPYPFVDVVLDRLAEALAERLYRDASYNMGSVRREVLSRLTEKVNAAVDARVEALVGPDLDERIEARISAAISTLSGPAIADSTLAGLVDGRVRVAAERHVNRLIGEGVLASLIEPDVLRSALAQALSPTDT